MPPDVEDNAVSAVQLGDYDMIFDNEGMEEEEKPMVVEQENFSLGEEEFVGDVEDLALVSAPVVTSDVLPSNQQPSKHESQISIPLTAVRSMGSIYQLPSLSPTPTALFNGETDMDLNRLRTRREPKPISKEVSEAIAIMDQEIRDLNEGQPKKRGRGRPKGWRKNGNTATAAAKSGSGTPTTTNVTEGFKKRGRPVKISDVLAREVYLKSKPEYTPFECEWRDPVAYPANSDGKCPAELQNLETLRRHIRYVHVSQKDFVCKWGKCAKKAETVILKTDAAWKQHIEDEHLLPYAWHMGDGIQNQGIDKLKPKDDPEKLPEYLFKDGVQVTPSVKDQQFEDTAGMLGRKRKLREIRRQANENENENVPGDREFRAPLMGKQVSRLKRKQSS